MDRIGWLLLRLILVPLGYIAAVLAGTLVIAIALLPPADASQGNLAIAIFQVLFTMPILLVLLVGAMWLPAAIGVLLSEAFAIRSWIFHAGNGAVAALLASGAVGSADESRMPSTEPLVLLAAGLVGGLTYWVIAGSSAGFWRPLVRRTRRAPLAAKATTPPPQIS